MTNRFTGRHMTAILIAFFLVVIGVNGTLAWLASSTFSGALAENGYVASQDYNRWIAQSAAQDRLGWSIATHVEERHLVLETRGVTGASADVILSHPLGLESDRRLSMAAMGGARLRSVSDVPKGRWIANLVIRQGGREARFMTEVRG